MADNIAGFIFMGLTLAVGLTVLAFETPRIPAWSWFALLIFWIVLINAATSDRWQKPTPTVLYCAGIFVSWALVLTVSQSGGMISILLVAVAAIGAYLLSLPWALLVVLLNSVVLFMHTLIDHSSLPSAFVFTSFYLVIHLATVFSSYALRSESLLRAELEQKNLELEASGVLLEDSAASTERLRISRELHDLIGHQLTVLNLELEAAKHQKPDVAAKHVQRASGVAKELLADVRTTVGELRDTGPTDLQHTLERLARSVPSLEIYVEVDQVAETDEETTATLIRAAQEIITNTIKHSDAEEIALTVTQAGSTITLIGTNDGTVPSSITEGNGLTGLRERVELLGGRLTVSLGREFTVEVRLQAHPQQRVSSAGSLHAGGPSGPNRYQKSSPVAQNGGRDFSCPSEDTLMNGAEYE